MTKIYTDKQVKDMGKQYILVQNYDESEEIQKSYCNIKKNPFTYLFVKLDKSGADFEEIYGCDSCNLDAYVSLIYTTNFNSRGKSLK